MSLPALDWGKLLSTTFPGLFLAVTIYMWVDIFSREELAAKALSGDEEVLGASIVSFITFATLLGVLLDAIGHAVFEEQAHRRLTAIQKIQEERGVRLLGYGRRPESFSSIYRMEVDAKAKQDEIDSHYRYTEFSINGTLALMSFAVAFPVFAWWELHVGDLLALAFGASLAAITGFLSAVAFRNIVEWETVKSELVFGTLDKASRQQTGGTSTGGTSTAG